MTSSTAIDTRFGSFNTNPKWVVTIPDGLPGFEQCRRFILVTSSAIEPFKCLQGLEGNQPSFLAIDPRLATPDFPISLSDDDRRRLDVSDNEPLLWLGLVRLTSDAALVNLRAPVVINPRLMIGLQVIDGESTLPTEYPLD